MIRKFEWVHAGNTNPETALDDAVRRWLEVAKDLWVSPKTEKTAEGVAIASTNIVRSCPLEDWLEKTRELLKK